jgi:tetratricopeptide (TPR) repeat protein
MSLFLASLAAILTSAPAAKSLGSIDFPITGKPACKAKFTEGMLALHSFEYDRAHESFQAAVQADPGCAMARWGDAMSYNHAIWGEEDAAAARAALGGIASVEKLTPKERAFIETARAVWSEEDFRPRQATWLRHAKKMHDEFPKDDEVALQHALALIANSERLRNVKRLTESAAISFEVFARRPNHPGAAHYIIHACDTADLAILGLPAARQYAKIAPAATHALHMPSHIFVQRGMWSEVATSNEASWAASELEDDGRKKSLDDRNWHSYSWLSAAYLELGRIKEAKALLDRLAENLKKEEGSQMRFAYAQMARQYLRDSGRWEDVDQVLAPVSKPLALEPGEPAGSLGCANHAPGATGKLRPPIGLVASMRTAQAFAEAAMRRGDEKAAAEALASAKRYMEAMEPWSKMAPPELKDRTARYEAAMIAGARAHKLKTPQAFDAAIEALKKLAELPDMNAGGPAFEPLAHELLGDMLLDANRPKEALAAYDTALGRAPMLSRSLLGAARAAKAAGDTTRAEELYKSLAAQWSRGDEDLTDLKEVRTAGGPHGAPSGAR